MPTLKARLFMMTVACLFTSCAVHIHDEPFCALIPGNQGAVCDNFLTSNQQILNEPEWMVLQMKWATAGQATECTTSDSVGDLKAEIEKLCSIAPCDYDTKTKIISGLQKVQALGKKSIALGQ